MYARITSSGTIDRFGRLPDIWRDGTGEDHDWRGNGPWRTNPADHGWHEVTQTERPDDTDTHTHDHSYAVADGLPVEVWTQREWAPQEIELRAQLTDLETRVKAIEDRLDPPQPPPTTTEGVKTLEQWGGRWPNETNLLDTDGTVYRNISGNILTTAPSGFPGEPSAWEHLFVVALAADEPVDPVDPTGAEPWVQLFGAGYDFGAERTHNGRLWRSTNPGIGTNTWEPGVYGWEDIGPA